jgi:glycosyltransferase involved in cell wall biosynthesis
MRVVYINNIPAPFMVQLAARMNQCEGIVFFLLAIKKDFSHRGNHWRDTLGSSENIIYYRGGVAVVDWVKKQIDDIKPDVVFTGLNKGAVFRILANRKKELKYKFGKWNEPYTPIGFSQLVSPLRNIYYRVTWKEKVDFILGIDDRAVSLYRSFVSKPEKIFFFPYYEDSESAEVPKKVEYPVIFLFSGRLIRYHNIKGLARASNYLLAKYPGKFKLVVSASGKSQKYLDKISSNQGSQEFIIYDTEFEKWTDRLRPFKNSHVLVLPSYKSGWGLVVNEALQLGLPVITTTTVGAGRYLVEHMFNGILIKPTTREIRDAMEYFILHPSEIERMSANALKVKLRYSLDIGVERMKEILQVI